MPTTAFAQVTVVGPPQYAPPIGVPYNRVSLCPLETAPIPNATSPDGDFEDTSIPQGQANPNWGDWQFTGSSGILHETHALAQANNGGMAHSGEYVAFLRSNGQIFIPVSLDAGIYRIRYFASRSFQNNSFDNQGVSISVNGVLLSQDEIPESTAYNSFATRPFSVPTNGGMADIQLNTTQNSPAVLLMDGIVLEKVCDWDVSTNWNPNGVPQPIDSVTIPQGHVVALPSLATVDSITCSGHLLTLSSDTEVFTGDMLITGPRSLFEVGHRNVPFLQDFTLTLTGVGQFVKGVNEKFLMARNGGLISLHGNPKKSWTRLLQDADVGANSVLVEDATEWNVGDEIVIVGSEGQHADPFVVDMPLHTSYSERRTITAISPGAGQQAELEFEAVPNGPNSLNYSHFGSASPQVYSNNNQSWTLENRAEVGCLTRNVKITSIDFGANKFGGHIMIMRKNDMGEIAGVARFSNVQLSKLGQRAGLGRYPFHWHMCKDLPQSQYIVNSSIHNSFNRAITIHGTDNALVSDNFSFRSHGHAIFLEDGSEQDNVITGNLVVATLRPRLGNETILSDNELGNFQNRTPASFWITNPQNTIDNNVAADSIGTGFWFALPREVLGLSSTNPNGHGAGNPDAHNPDSMPHQMDLTSFDGNLAHGCRSGIDFHDGVHTGLGSTIVFEGQLLRNLQWFPASGSAALTNFTAYANDQGVYSGTGTYIAVSSGISLIDSIFADNHIGIRLASSDSLVGCAFVSKSRPDFYQVSPLLIPGPPETGEVYEAYRLYDGAGRIDNCHFIGYDEPDSLMFGVNPAAIRDTYHRISNLSAADLGLVRTNSSKFGFRQYLGGGVNFQDRQPGSWGFSLLDEDGTLTSPGTPQLGYMGHSVTSNHPWMTDVGVPGVTLPGHFAHVAPYRFGHMILLQPNPDSPNNPVTFPFIVCERRRVDNQSLVSTYLHDFRSPFDDPAHGPNFLKQLPLTVSDLYDNPTGVNDRHYYEFEWSQFEPVEFELRFQELHGDDVALLCFDFSALVNPAVTGQSLVPVNTAAEVMDLTVAPGTSVYFLDLQSSKLYLRVWKFPKDEFIQVVR